ncbi:phosphotransferase [Saccharibacillus sp. CPCC 101409]|uniref:phosphotransferase n=1 Tax=Saccharibacillus sp. CPCC 101409 TaxID=3058041 RepID=UPI0026718FFA|nr:phosphotransferase [Saccharibacillus sp. CPCC 101409]MDO3413343.1 phosphotransferase [Saccharibacillus sp. CPCC 101409]
MTGGWAPEHAVTAEEAAALIAAQFPRLAPPRVEPFGEGFDNTIFRVNEKWVFRFPRRALAAELLRTELRLLPELAGRLPLAVPEPVYIGSGGNGCPWPFAGFTLVAGSVPETPTRAQRLASAEPLALFLRELHGFPAAQARELGLRPDTLGRLDLAKRRPMLEANLLALEEAGPWAGAAAALDFARGSGAHGPAARPHAPAVVPVHGDLHLRNLIADGEGRVCGVIDWGDAHLGHPAIDLSIAYAFLPPEGREIFFAAYGEADADTRRLARFKGVYTAVLLLRYARARGEADLAAAAEESVRLALE